MDRALALALVAYEDALCPCGCGWPRDRAWDDDADGWFVVQEATCYARAALDRWRSEHSKAEDTEPGVLTYTVDERLTPETG